MNAGELLLLSTVFSSLFSSFALVMPPRSIDTKNAQESRLPDEPGALTALTWPINHEVGKRAIETDQQESKEESIPKENFLFRGENLEKRNKMGFTGMRGKKEMNGQCGNSEACHESDNIEKRALKNYKELFGGKRAPFAFHGMRGKKSWDYDGEWIEPEFLNFGRISFGKLLDDGTDTLRFAYAETADDAFGEGSAIRKRSPYSFQGMRGKKMNSFDLKRAMGFLGMRGKKSMEIWEDSDDYKRTPQSAFFGMKGKKAQSGFFGMRGKKPASTSFYDIPGDTDPFNGDYHELNNLDNFNEKVSSVIRYRRGSPWLYKADKKAKNAFFGVKGKKSTDQSSLSENSTTKE